MSESIRKRLEKLEGTIFLEHSSSNDVLKAIEALDHTYQSILSGKAFNIHTVSASLARIESKIKNHPDVIRESVFSAISELMPFSPSLLTYFVCGEPNSIKIDRGNTRHIPEIVRNIIREDSLEEFSESLDFQRTMLAMVINDELRPLAEDIAINLINIYSDRGVATKGLSDLIRCMLQPQAGMASWVAQNEDTFLEPLEKLKFGRACDMSFSKSLMDGGAYRLAKLCANNSFYNARKNDLIERYELLGIKLEASDFSRMIPASTDVTEAVLRYLNKFGTKEIDPDKTSVLFRATEIRAAMFDEEFYMAATPSYIETTKFLLSKLDNTDEYEPAFNWITNHAGINDPLVLAEIHQHAISAGLKGKESSVLDIVHFFSLADTYKVDCSGIGMREINDDFYSFFCDLTPKNLRKFFQSDSARSVFGEQGLVALADSLKNSSSLNEDDFVSILPVDISSKCQYLKKALISKDFGL